MPPCCIFEVVENKVLMFAKYMSLMFAAFSLLCLIDYQSTPKTEIQYVLAHENEIGYRSKGKFGAEFFRDNFLHTIPFCVHTPYRFRPRESDTQLLYPTLEVRRLEAQEKLQKSQSQKDNLPLHIVKISVALDEYYALEDGDSLRLFFSPMRGKVVAYLSHLNPRWLNVKASEIKSLSKKLNPNLAQWLFTSQVFALIVLGLSSITWFVNVFHVRVGIFVFNLVITSILNWFY